MPINQGIAITEATVGREGMRTGKEQQRRDDREQILKVFSALFLENHAGFTCTKVGLTKGKYSQKSTVELWR